MSTHLGSLASLETEINTESNNSPSVLAEKQQQMEAEQHESYVPADQDLHVASWRGSTAPPHQQPGERRKAEMKKLYGEDSAKIMAMEAAMQLTFDRNRDLKQPKYWPVIPLKL